ncbi:MAG: 3-phosphoshikimate 1-carboxyvinyltransferase [Phycisphaerales bacterium]|nr:3-phosphoshikimate 1-carboxyvinyltransferase [Phycisphaerales bacterium]
MLPTVRDIAKLPIDQWPAAVRVEPVRGAFDIEVRPPGSKSLTNRALLLAALAEGVSTLTGALVDADDAQVMIAALRKLGAKIEITPEVDDRGESCGNATLRVRGVGGRWKIEPGEVVTLDLHNAGTATRSLTAAAVLQPADAGGIVIDGNARMRERPIGELAELLRELGVKVEELGKPGCVPLKVYAMPKDLVGGRELAVPTTASSQFISALMLIAPFVPGGLALRWVGPVTSWSYIKMTEGMINAAGAVAIDEGARVMRVHGPAGPTGERTSRLSAFAYAVEPDASGATYMNAAAALMPESRCIQPAGGFRSLQGDVAFMGVLEKAGARSLVSTNSTNVVGGESVSAFDLDMGQMPDAAMTAAVLASFASGGACSTLTGLRTLRVKETDRVAALIAELAKVGVKVESFTHRGEDGADDEGIRITPPTGGIDCSAGVPLVEFETYDDHRMAMSLALIGLRRPNVVIKDPACVRKTYPTFWRDLAKVYSRKRLGAGGI